MISPSNKSGRLILDLINEAGITQSELSASTNVSVGYTNHVLTGRRLPSPDWLDVVSSAMKLPPDRARDLHKAAADDLVRQRGYRTED